MVLPWSHRLPDYAAANPAYGQNLVELARLLATPERPLTVLDIGANVGDSAMQILNATDARVLCVEGDKAYLDFLRLNVGDDPRVTIVEGLLAVGDDRSAGTAVRSGGTTRFVEGDGDAMPTVSTDALRQQNPDFADLRLVKSDTDGYDVTLVPAVAATWKDARPVAFFEYDPELTRIAGHDPAQVWTDLADLGYRDVAVWDNGATPLGRTTTQDITSHTASLDATSGRPWSQARTYWDVAVVHEDDEAGRAALDALVPSSLVL
jgi:FkbM family methyltransferase